MIQKLLLFAAILIASIPVFASSNFSNSHSYYTLRPEDAHAVYLEKGNFGVHADGVHDDSDALQQAINRVQETTYDGVVFVPEGRYRLAKTVYVWEGIRLIGYGKRRPVFVMGKNTPGFQQGERKYMLWFTDYRPKPGEPVIDASEFTFFSGVNNIDFELQAGNPAAVAIRFHVAQHGVLTHIDFHLGSAKAALEDIGNQASDIHIYGGQYGIITKKTSPAWQFLLMDSSFEGQSVAAIRTQEAGFTLVRDRFTNMPVALEIPPGQVEQLYGRDLWMKDIGKAALVTGDTKNLRSEITLEHVACNNVPHFVQGKEAVHAPSKFYVEERFTEGLNINDAGREGGIAVHHLEHALLNPSTPVASDVPALPPMSEWVDVKTLGVKGDGGTDDTAALQAAIDQHRVLFLPSGMYRLTGSLKLRGDTVLIGFSPATTQLTLWDETPEFAGSGETMPLLIAPKDGTNIVSGIGISTGMGNPRAAGILWMAASKSLLDDVTFVPGHTRYIEALSPAHAAPPRRDRAQMEKYFETQGPDLWVKDGGGGILRGLWTHGSFSHQGLLVENTSTPTSIYQLSCEHHIHNEVQLHHVQNWRIYDLQTEEEYPAGSEALAVEIEGSKHITFANTYMYRVSRSIYPKLYAVTTHDSSDIHFDNVKVFSQTRLAFDNSVFDENSGVKVRAHHFVQFAVQAGMKAPTPLPLPSGIFAEGAKLEKLATGFTNASGLTADEAGKLFFTDAAMHKIYRWNAAAKQTEVIGQIPGRPMVAGLVPPSSLLVVGYEKAVYSLDTDKDEGPLEVPETEQLVPGTKLLLPVGLHNELAVLTDLVEHRGYVYRHGSNTAIISVVPNEHRGYFYAPGTKTAIMAGGTWRPMVQSSQMASFGLGEMHFVVSEDDEKTYRAVLDSYNKMSTGLFVERGGTSVVSDAAGNVYIASGEVYIYNRAGKQMGVLDIPERPESLAFGGPEHRTLFIGARSSLYAIRTAAAGSSH